MKTDVFGHRWWPPGQLELIYFASRRIPENSAPLNQRIQAGVVTQMSRPSGRATCGQNSHMAGCTMTKRPRSIHLVRISNPAFKILAHSRKHFLYLVENKTDSILARS